MELKDIEPSLDRPSSIMPQAGDLEKGGSAGLPLSEEVIKRYKSIQYLAFSMNSIDDEEELFSLMLSQCVSLTGADFGAVLMPDYEPDFLRARVAYGISEAKTKNLRLRLGQSITGRVFQDGLPRLLSDVSLDPAFAPVIDGVRSEIAVPMSHLGSIFGVVRLDSRKESNFSDNDLDLLVTVASHAAQHVFRAKLKKELERKVMLQEILIKISAAVDSLFDLKDVFEAVTRQMAENFSIMRGWLVLFDQNQPNELSVHSAYNLTEEETSRGIYKVGEGIIGKAVETGETIAIPDINKEKTFLNRMQIKRRKDIPTSFIAVPFRVEGQVAGVIAVEKAFESMEILKDESDLVRLISTIIADKVRVFQRHQLEKEKLIAENQSLRQELKRQYSPESFVCKNRKMTEILDLVSLVADSTTSIMVLGESGTGKEMIARLIHQSSGRREDPFVSVNCAAIPENLLESELFGYKKGAFTGAVQDKKGKFQLADKGTLFLDEIGDMPLHLQVKLLRAIQDKEVEPVGGEKKEKVDIRILAATNRDLRKLIQENKFREDLYYRLNVVEIKIPPLRERSDDIPFLVNHFVGKFAIAHGKSIEGVSPIALRMLQAYSWPGNVRELENVIERAVLLCRSSQIEPSHLPSTMSQGQEGGGDGQFISRWVAGILRSTPQPGTVWDEVLGIVEKELIQQSMLANARNKVRTADYLGINRNTLRTKIERFGLE
jgi:Nif-specific regulatory protein